MSILKRKEARQEKQSEGMSGIAHAVALKETPVKTADSKTLQRRGGTKAERCGRVQK
jgi:hypothetical protein